MLRRLVWVLVCVGVSACADRTSAPIVPLQTDVQQSSQSLLVATNRERNELGFFSDTRADETVFLRTVIGIPPGREPGDAPKYSDTPNPKKHFVIAEQDKLSDKAAFLRELKAQLNALPPDRREVTLFVHGYFNAYSDSVFRGAQIFSDFDNPGVGVVFSWPSAGRPTGYTYDRESVLFARDSLEEVLRVLAQAGARNVLIMAHSMGGLLTMETLRQIELTDPNWASQNISSVLLISPDIAVDLFKEQLERFDQLPSQFVVFTSKSDRALRISSAINAGSDRLGLGNSSTELSNYPIIFVDVTSYNEDAGSSHFVVAESPAFIAMASGAAAHEEFARGRSRNILDTITDSTVRVDQTVIYHLGPDENPAELR